MSDRRDPPAPPVGSAADWYVELDAEPGDAGAERELAVWLVRDERNEADYARCEAAVWLARQLESDPDLEWAFNEAEELARRGPGHAGEPGAPAARRGAGAATPRWAGALAAGLAVGALVIWLLSPDAPERAEPALAAAMPAAMQRGDSDGAAAIQPRDASAASERSALSRMLVDDAVASTSNVTLPGQVVVDAGAVAVLPFVNLSRNPADGSIAAHFDAGLAAELHAGIVAELGRIPGVQVVNRHAVMSYAGLELPPRDVAAELGVRGIVNGSLQSEAGRVEIDVELVDAVDGRRLWSLRESRPAAELGAVRARVAAEVAAALAGAERRAP